MKIAIPKERRAGEARVAASPDTVRKLAGEGAAVGDADEGILVG